MATVNSVKREKLKTFEGGPSCKLQAIDEFKRILLNCLLWENTFYKSGDETATRMAELIQYIPTKELTQLVVMARDEFKLRHAPVYIAVKMLDWEEHAPSVLTLLPEICKRPDDLTEALAIYWKDGKKPIAKVFKKAIQKTLQNYSAYQLGKYKNKGDVKIIDLFNLCHPMPKDRDQAKLWKTFVAGKLEAPVTWETELSKGGDKRKAWEMLVSESKLGALAYLRNLRNMREAGLSESLIRQGLKKISIKNVLPFRFVAAAKTNPFFQDAIEVKMFEACEELEGLSGRTVIMVDVSGSMDCPMSQKSDLNRMDAACAMAMILREKCEYFGCYSFSNQLVRLRPNRGFSLAEAIKTSQPNRGTYLGHALQKLHDIDTYDRIIIITDEQSSDKVPRPVGKHNYIINVGAYSQGISQGEFTTISGFSEGILKYISMVEKSELNC